MSDKTCSSVGVVGAGIQGVCTGLQLLKKNIPTTIFDQNDPGSMASYGNAGHFSPYAVIQLNRPDILYDIPKDAFKFLWTFSIEMELYSKNASMDFQIFKKL